MTEPTQNHGMEVKLDLLHQDVSDIKAVLKELTVAINRLAVVEERQSETAKSMERVFAAIEKIMTRLAALEQGAVVTGQTNRRMDKLAWGAIGIVTMYILRKVGLVG